VENACVHGVESVSRNRKVKICVAVIDNQLVVSVSDNGIGIDEERLAELKLMFQGGKRLTHSVGLYNVYQRLSLYYGKNFTMDIHSQERCGTDIDIIIPARYLKEEF
jgi:two-component system sensor histidine kinase YesM